MNAASGVRLTFLLCQIAMLILGSELEPSSSSCTDCHASSSPPSAPNSAITADEIRREMLRWEKEKILRQLEEADELETEWSGSSSNQVRRVRSSKRSKADAPVAANGKATLNDTVDDADTEEYTETAIIMGQAVKRGSTTTVQCYDEHGRMGTCIDFKNKTDIKWDRFKFAILRFRLNEAVGSSTNHTFTVKAINYGRPDASAEHHPANVSVNIDAASRKYIEIDVTNQILRRAMAYSQSAKPEDRDGIHCIMTLRITCLTCGNTARSPISLDETRLPFLEIGFTGRKRRSSPPCELLAEYMIKDAAKRGCCMVPIEVNFADIEMEYILHPQRYRTNYCSGRCYHYTTRSYSVVIQNVINKRLQRKGYDEQMSFCCFPVSTSNLPIVYQNESGAVLTSVLREMLVNSCGC